MKEKMRYIAKKVNDEEVEFTHIWEQEGLDGNMIEVIKGRNVIVVQNMKETLVKLKEDRESQFAILDNNIMEIEKMIEAAELAVQE